MRSPRALVLGLVFAVIVFVFLALSSETPLRSSAFLKKRAKRWIVLTTTNRSLGHGVQRFLSVPGWQVLVLGDEHASSWESGDAAIFLSAATQKTLPYSMVSFGSGVRKNLGYLFAIEHGAEEIFDTEEESVLRDAAANLTEFFASPPFFGYSFGVSSSVINPYAHFGEPTIWPRGFPLDLIGRATPVSYHNTSRTSRWLVRQSLSLGEPDVDLICQLTRRLSWNVAFDLAAPPVACPPGVFSPWNSQATHVSYDAFWGLVLPTSTLSPRVSDVWRGYFTQRLLWEADGVVAWYPPAVQKTSSRGRNLTLDLISAEMPLYEDTGRLIDFLLKWTPEAESLSSMSSLMTSLAWKLVDAQLWSNRDAKLLEAWTRDLELVGYRYPPLQRSMESLASPLSWTPRWQCAPEQASSVLFPGLMLVIIFNTNRGYENVPFLKDLYGHIFGSILFYGPLGVGEVRACQHTRKSPGSTHGEAFYVCVSLAIRACKWCTGWMVIGDDTLLNWWTLRSMNQSKFWIPEGGAAPVYPPPGDNRTEEEWDLYRGWWFPNKEVGMPAVRRAYAALPSAWKAVLSSPECGGAWHAWGRMSDAFYVPRRFALDWLELEAVFSRIPVFVEIATPSIMAIAARCHWQEGFEWLTGKYLWGKDREGTNWLHHWNVTEAFLHPVKFSQIENQAALPGAFRYYSQKLCEKCCD